jgi:peroxiredoxin-like protein
MKPFPHRYEVRLAGGPIGYAELSTAGAPPLSTAPPPQFDGAGDAWSPEHLLLAAAQACFLFTLRAVARHAKVEFRTLDLEASGTVDRSGGVTRFTDILLRPTITVDARASRDAVLRVLTKTEQACLISASLSTPVRLEPRVVVLPAGDDTAQPSGTVSNPAASSAAA